jgi:hypothetical protein
MMLLRRSFSGLLLSLCATQVCLSLALARQVDEPVKLNKAGKLEYVTDSLGNRVPDFSSAGYAGGGKALPLVPGAVLVKPVEGDDTAVIQAALDRVSARALDAHGFRGAVVLDRGEFQVAGALHIRASGVVLRGQGNSADGTVIVAAGVGRRSLIQISGVNDRKDGAEIAVAGFVPVGGTVLPLSSTKGLRVGQSISVRRPSTAAWIEQLGMNDAPARTGFAWKPGTIDVIWDRSITEIKNGSIVLDAPLTTALDPKFGGGMVATYEWSGRVERIGVENLRCVSSYDAANPKDEEHAWIAVQIEAARDVWVSDVVAEHFVSSAVYVGSRVNGVTVQDCASLAPVSEIAGYRRHAFYTAGQQTFFLRCRSEDGINDFITGYVTPGPNVFLECVAQNSHGFSGSIGSWSTGVLFDSLDIDAGELRLDNLETWNQGVGWSAANSVIWGSKAARIICRNPPGASNWANGVWAMFVGDGTWSRTSEFAEPDSLYRIQLKKRLGDHAEDALTARAGALRTLDQSWLAAAPTGPADSATVLRREQPGAPDGANAAPGLVLANGWISAGDRLLFGTQQEINWWRGNLNPTRTDDVGPTLTRFVPGRSGLGATDDLAELAGAMAAANKVVLRHHWGLWYDRRSDDHQMVRRPDADVWPPFYEQPWARTGEGEGWSRLSKYDLTKFNPWYFGRLREFAQQARRKGLVLVNEMYFQHNILEAGAHWASFPWRPANNLQETGFPEPPPYAGDKRIFMADLFYDVNHPVRRELHRLYVRQCLNNLADEPNVIHTTGFEYSGPLHFVQFWFDLLAEWERETGKRPVIALSAPKDVQDAILADPVRAPLVSAIDFTYWWRNDKGEFAPKGGQNLAPRQSEREWKGGKPDALSLASMVREYRERFPEKAVITSLKQNDAWAFVAAGGSLPSLPPSTDAALLRVLPKLKLVAGQAGENVWRLGDGANEFFVYAAAGARATLDLSGVSGSFQLRRIDPSSGTWTADAERVSAGGVINLSNSAKGPTIVWLSR